MTGGARIIITRVVAPGELADEIVPPMRRLGNALHRRVQRLVPKRTWRLHDTVVSDVEVDGAKVRAVVGVGGPTDAAPEGADYWEHVERGTSRMRAQPYMRPALLQTKSADLKSTTEPDEPRGGRS